MEKVLYKVQPNIFPAEYGYLMLGANEAKAFPEANRVDKSQLDSLVQNFKWFTGEGSQDTGYRFVRQYIRQNTKNTGEEAFSQCLSEGSHCASYIVNKDAYAHIENEAKKTPTPDQFGDLYSERYFQEYFEIKNTGGLFEMGPPVLSEMLFYTQARDWPLMTLGTNEAEIEEINVVGPDYTDGQNWEITLSVKCKVNEIRGPISYECYIRPHDLSFLITTLRPTWVTKFWSGD